MKSSSHRSIYRDNLLNLNTNDDFLFNEKQHDSMEPWQQNFDNFLTFKEMKRGWPKEYRNPNNSFTNLTNKNLYNRIVDYNRENNQKYDQLNQRIYQKIQQQKKEQMQQFDFKQTWAKKPPNVFEFPLFQQSKMDFKLCKIDSKAIKLININGDPPPEPLHALTDRPVSSYLIKTIPHLKQCKKQILSNRRIQLKIDDIDVLQLPKKVATILELPKSPSPQHEFHSLKIYKPKAYKKKIILDKTSSSHEEWKKRQEILLKIKNFHNRSLK